MSFTEALARHAAETKYSALPAHTVRSAQRFILDSLGVAMAGRRAAFRDQLVVCAQGFGQSSEARVWVTGERLPAAHAAMVNAYQIHSQEFDCVHEAAVVHPMAVILAALLAHAERQADVSGRDLLLAVVLAVDVAASLGMAARSAIKFFRPAQCGALGAVAALTRLRGGAADAVRNAFGVCLGQLSGTMQAHREGVPLLPMQIAFNARNAVVASDLSAAGLIGPRDALEGEFGYLQLFESASDVSGLADALGERWRINEVSHKPYPSGRATHGGIDALQQLLGRGGLQADQIAAVTLYAPPLIRQLVDRPLREAMSPNYAKLCFPFVAARCLQSGGVDIEDFDAAALTNEATQRLASRVGVRPDGTSDPNALTPQRLELKLHSGALEVIEITNVLGSPANPLSESQHLAKFERNAKREGIDPSSVIEAVENLPQTKSLRPLLDAMIAPR